MKSLMPYPVSDCKVSTSVCGQFSLIHHPFLLQGGVCLAFADEVLCWLYGTVKESRFPLLISSKQTPPTLISLGQSSDESFYYVPQMKTTYFSLLPRSLAWSFFRPICALMPSHLTSSSCDILDRFLSLYGNR